MLKIRNNNLFVFNWEKIHRLYGFSKIIKL